MLFRFLFPGVLIVPAFWCAACPGSAGGDPIPRPPIRVPSGFEVSLFADDDLAHNIYSLTIDAHGQVVVSGPGYVRTLIDSDGDGRADRYETFADGPKTGAQGMCFTGPHLIASGDEGIQVFRDENRDGRADGEPRTVLKVKAGGEHHVHSVQRGPDGWWYVIAGNMAGVTGEFSTVSTSPLRRPEAGVIMRLKPDLSGGEILSDGFRNAYDFAFSESGDLFTYDSDGERDVSLPWYVPTRVVHATPRSHAGWTSRSWKRPLDFPDAPPTLAGFGRGSPTGVVCYRHTQFPGRYRGALLVQDWTFGRIRSIALREDRGHWKSDSAIFAEAAGTFGFAPTDIEVGPDGSVFVSVGGRGTRGGVYRISYAGAADAVPPQSPPRTVIGRLNYVLGAPQPLTAWSRALWHPVARELGKEAIAGAATDELRPPAQRVRAIEILTDVFDGPDDQTLQTLTGSLPASVRARAAWAAGRANPASPDFRTISVLLQDKNHLVRRFAVEALMGVTDKDLLTKCIPQLAVIISSDVPSIRAAGFRLMARLTPEQHGQLKILTKHSQRALVAIAMGTAERSAEFHAQPMELAATVLGDAAAAPGLRAEAIRLLQLSLGDVGPQEGRTPVLEGYTARANLSAHERQLRPVRQVVENLYLSGESEADRELLRCIGMLGSDSADVMDAILKQITAESHPTADIHRLVVLTQCRAQRTEDHASQIAGALVNLDVKVQQRNLKQDSNWDDRLTELFELHASADKRIPVLMIDKPGFGLPGHIMFFRGIPAEVTQHAIDRLGERAARDANYEWTNDVIFALGRSKNPAHRNLIRDQAGNPSIEDSVLLVLAREPTPADRGLFVSGLNSPHISVVVASVTALKALPKSNDPREQFRLLEAARRLNHNQREYTLREDVIRLLQNNNVRSFAFVFGRDGHVAQSQALTAWRDHLQQRYPELKHLGDGGRDAHQVLSSLSAVDWGAGDVAAGKRLFEKLTCSRCHGGRSALGPDLAGTAKRFSRHDLFAAIADPNRDVSDRYQVTNIVTSGGRVYAGLVVYESVDGVTLRDSDHRTIRIEADDIESRVRSRTSLMPGGLLRNVTAQDLANLDAYLRSL